MTIIIKKVMANNTILHKNWILLYNHLELYYKSFYFRQYFHYILQLIYQLAFLYIYNFHNLNILQHHIFITFTIIITRIPNKSCITFTFANQFFTFTLHFSLIQHCLLLQTLASSLHLHLQVSCHSICLYVYILYVYI